MVTRYFDVDPLAVGLAYGFNEFIGERRRLDEINRQKNLAKKARRKKNLITGLTAAAGAVALPLAAPALGLAGAAGAAGVPLTAGGTALGTAGATAGTAGMFGVGGALTGAGTLAAGLTGAGIGANVGGALAEGDVGQAISSFAGPMAGMYAVENNRRMAADDRASRRSENIADALYLDNARTEGNIKQAQALYDIQNYGMPRADATRMERESYESSLGGFPSSGDDILPGDFDTMPAMGPLSAPGPSEIPGMKRDFGPLQYRQLAKLEQERADTVDNPEWVNSHTPEQREAQFRSLQRAKANIRPTTLPDQPRPMYTTSDGQSAPMKLGENVGQNGTYVYDGKDITHIQKQSKPEAVQYYSMSPEEQELHLNRALPNGGLKAVRDSNGIIKVKQNGEVDVEWPTSKGGSGFDEKMFIEPELDGDGQKTGKNVVLPPDQVVKRQEELVVAKEALKYGAKVAERRQTLRSGMRRMQEQYPGGPDTMPPRQREFWESFKAEYLGYGE